MATVADVAAPAAVAVEAPAMENDAVLKEAMRLGEGEKKVEEEPKPRKRKPTLHPPYFEMIREAILAQAADGKSGSTSPYAIARYMGDKYRDVLPPGYRKMLAVQLRSLAAKGRLVKVKGSFKLAAAEAAEEKKVAAVVMTAARAPAKRRRTANPRRRKPRSAGPHHPPYFEMIKDAILADGGKSAGCSPYRIAKYVGEKHRDVLPASYRKMLAVKLRSFAAMGHLVKVKASFKLAPAEEEEEEVAAAVKKAVPAAKRRRTPRANKSAAAATEAKKPRTKLARKAAPAPAPSQLKPVRAGGTKKAKQGQRWNVL